MRKIFDSIVSAIARLREQAICSEAFCYPLDIDTDNDEDVADGTDHGQQALQSLGLGDLDSAALRLPDPLTLKPTPKQTVLRDKLSFFLGLLNVVLTAYWLGHSPETWSNWYTVKASVLLTVRFFLYRQRKWSFYLIEFCYYANVLLLLEIWAFPHSHLLHKVVFGLCAGPITFCIPALKNSLVLHSLDKTTSLFIHLAPAIMAWCSHWHPNESLRKARMDAGWFTSSPDKKFPEAKWWELMVLPMVAYLVWAILYYIKVFVISSDKIFKEHYSNMYTLMVMNSQSKPAQLVLKAPKKLQPAVYLLMHCLLCWLATLAAAVFWHSKRLHTACLILCAATSAWNGATYFFDVFAHRYADSVGISNKKH